MKKWLIFIISILAVWLPVKKIYGETTGNVNFSIGVLKTASDFSQAFDIDERTSIGASCDVKNATWPISIAFEYLLSYHHAQTPANSSGMPEGMDIDLYCSEMFVGAKKVFVLFPSVRPFVAGGLYTVNMYMDVSRDHEFDSGIGGWVGAGAYFTLSKNADIGFEWKWSKAEINVFNTRVNTGGNSFNLLIGHHF